MKLNGAIIPDGIVRRVIERRGSEHCFAELDPARTALVVIDLQHAFMNEAVGFAPVPAARDIVPAVNRLGAAVRRNGGGVFWVKMTHDERCFAEWSVAYEMPTPELRDKRIAALSEGTLGHELWPDLEVRPQLVAECPFGQRGDALVAQFRRRHLVGDRPLGEATLVMGHLDPEHAAAVAPHRRAEAVDRRHDVPRRRHRCKADRLVHESVLQVDHDERGARRVEFGEAVLAAAALDDAADDPVRNDGAVQFHRCLPCRDVSPVGGRGNPYHPP